MKGYEVVKGNLGSRRGFEIEERIWVSQEGFEVKEDIWDQERLRWGGQDLGSHLVSVRGQGWDLGSKRNPGG